MPDVGRGPKLFRGHPQERKEALFNPPTSYDVIPDYVKLEDFHKYPEDYVVRPPYQRKNVWTPKKKQALLDSLFRRYYVPKIVLREIKLADRDKKNEVIDGQQRIRVAQEFYEDELTLPQSLADLDNSLPGRKYSELSVKARRFVDKTLRYDVDTVKGIDDPRNPEHQQTAAEIFWRLQQGETLNYMEVAHARLSSLPRNFVVKYADDISFDYDSYLPIEDNPDTHSFFPHDHPPQRPNAAPRDSDPAADPRGAGRTGGYQGHECQSSSSRKGTTPTVSGTTPTKTPRRHGPRSPICRHSTACSATM